MDKCKCSERPLGILHSKVIVEEGIPYQVLIFGCTNKRCSEYKKGAVEKRINLFDNSKTEEISL
ncbi:MAG: hypothetical protein IJO54_06940 [Oscillospiraceae bacterium]|nr:hypothetical protein [Oscillospiraceae bacterium]